MAVVPLRWSSGSRFYNASLQPAYAGTPLPVLRAFTAANARLQSDYAPEHHKHSIWTHTAFVPPALPAPCPLASVFSKAAAAALIEPPSKRRKGTNGAVAAPEEEMEDDAATQNRVY